MANNELGTPRRSHCVGNLGPGAIGEFRVGNNNGAANSVVIGGHGLLGLDGSPPAGIANDQVTFERRLQKFLKVQGFRLPPVDPDRDWKKSKNIQPFTLGAVRFPMWLQCPRCYSVKAGGELAGQRQTCGDPTRKNAGKCTLNAGREIAVGPGTFCDRLLRRASCRSLLKIFWLQHKAGLQRTSKLKLSSPRRLVWPD